MHAPATEVGLVVGALGSSVARGKYSQLATDVAAGTDESEEEAASVATLLSGFLLGALVIEAARDCGTKTSEAFYRSFAQIDERVRHAFPCDINETAKAFILRFHSGE